MVGGVPNVPHTKVLCNKKLAGCRDVTPTFVLYNLKIKNGRCGHGGKCHAYKCIAQLKKKEKRDGHWVCFK